MSPNGGFVPSRADGDVVMTTESGYVTGMTPQGAPTGLLQTPVSSDAVTLDEILVRNPEAIRIEQHVRHLPERKSTKFVSGHPTYLRPSRLKNQLSTDTHSTLWNTRRHSLNFPRFQFRAIRHCSFAEVLSSHLPKTQKLEMTALSIKIT